MDEINKKDKLHFGEYPMVEQFAYLDDNGNLKYKKFNYHDAVNSAWQKVKKQLEVQIEQALLKGVEGEE